MDRMPTRLDDLIDFVTNQHPDGGPLDHLSDAVLVSDYLGEVSDHLVGHFVDQARRTGASWTEIGRSMGVTKQAAQKRFVAKPDGGLREDLGERLRDALGKGLREDLGKGLREKADGPVFSRLTGRARSALIAAQEEARAGRQGHVAAEHILLGLLRDPEGLAAKAVAALTGDADAVRAAVAAELGPPRDDVPPAQIPLTVDAKRSIEAGMREADRYGHKFIGTEHLLLGLLRASKSEAVQAIAGPFGADAKTVEGWLVKESGEFRSRKAAEPPRGRGGKGMFSRRGAPGRA
jgi:hypothetical protein